MTRLDLGSDLLNYIIKSGFQPGDRLPTISELASPDHLNISISKVREQLEVARALGLVEVRSKTGTRLKEYTFTPAVRLTLLFALASNADNFEYFSALRNHVEVAFWEEACELLQDADIKTMRQCINSAREKLRSPFVRIPNDEHREFHLTVFQHLENPFVTGLLEAYWDAYATFEVNRYADYDYLTSVWDYHEQILDQICAGNYAAAKETFIEHTRLLRHKAAREAMKGAEID